MLQSIAVLVGLFLAALAYYVLDLIQQRKSLKGLPQPPMQNNLIGHLQLAGECTKLFPHLTHPHCYGIYLQQKYNLPEIFFVDWRPFGGLYMYITDPEITARYVTTQQSLPKSPLMTRYMDSFLGKNNLVSLEGSHWKSLRSIFNPGFSASNLITLTDYIVDASMVFKHVLLEKAQTNELFELEEYATRLTMDIIGKICLDADMNCQVKPHPIALLFRERVRLMPAADALFPWEDFRPLRPVLKWWNRVQLDRAIYAELEAKIKRRAHEKGGNTKRSVLDLALAAYDKEVSMGNITGGEKGLETSRVKSASQLPANFRRDIIDSVKTFFFAGHDTSSSSICWVFYVLHRYPTVYSKLKAELDTYFPSGSDSAAIIKENPHIINKLEYLSALIKEVMRVFPPASTLRTVYRDPNKPAFVTDQRTGQKLPLDIPGVTVWPVAHMIHRNKRFFPKPLEFIPERFIQSRTPFPDAELFQPSGKEAWRPFERGPRQCIGQELAILEIKIVVALLAREFDFVVEYPGEPADLQYPIPESVAAELDENTEYGKGVREGKIKPDRIEGHRIYQQLKGSAKPADGASGRIYVRK